MNEYVYSQTTAATVTDHVADEVQQLRHASLHDGRICTASAPIQTIQPIQ